MSRQNSDFIKDGGDGRPLHKKAAYFFEYLKLAHDLCRERITEDCSYKVMEALKINDDVITDCVDATFDTKGEYIDEDKDENFVFA